MAASDDEEIKQTLVGCFPDFRHRTTSFDLHQIGNTIPPAATVHQHHHKMSLINKLFRSRSDGSLKIGSPKTSPSSTPKQSPHTSPKSSPSGLARRRFVRVVKNEESEGEEYENPHVIRKYSRGYLKTQYLPKSTSLEDHDRPLPYTVSGHTILKKHQSQSVDSPASKKHSHSVDALNKHASFNEDVEVLPFDKKSKCDYIRTHTSCILHARLQDDLENLSDSSWSESLTDQEIPESDEDNYRENLEDVEEPVTVACESVNDNANKKVATFNLNNVSGEEDMSDNEDTENIEPAESKNCVGTPVSEKCLKDSTNTKCSSPKIVKQNSDEGVPAPKKSKFVRTGSLDSADSNQMSVAQSMKSES